MLDGKSITRASAGAPDRLSARLKSRADRLSPALMQVATYLDAHRLDTLMKSASELAEAIGTSDATVIRTVKALGFDGLPELRSEIASQIGVGATPLDNMHRTMSDLDQTTEHPVDHVMAAHAEAVANMSSSAVRQTISKAIEKLSRAKRVVVFGIGPSSFIAGYFASLLARSGRQTHLLNASGNNLADQLLGLQSGDCVVMLAYGRIYNEASATLTEARRLRLPVILVSDSSDHRLTRQADILLQIARGKADRVSLHGATVVCLEALMVGVATADRPKSTAGLNRLNSLRRAIRTGKESDDK